MKQVLVQPKLQFTDQWTFDPNRKPTGLNKLAAYRGDLVEKQTAVRAEVKYYREAKYNPIIINIAPATLPVVSGSLNSR